MPHRTPPLLALAGAALIGTITGLLASAPANAAGTIRYAALGDSYSSGVGAGGYDSSGCSRSNRSYPALWAAAHAVTSFTFLACGGATTTDVLNKQVGGLSASTTLVTITIGGNDAGFVEVVTTCLLGTDGACGVAVDAAGRYAAQVLPAKLDRTFAAIRSHAPNARVIVLGYPRLFELAATCGPLSMDLAKRQRLDGGADAIDGVIAARAGAAGDTFVDARPAFAGHGICAAQPWINSTTWPVTDSYHPTSGGYQSGYLPALNHVTG
jgi:lysophospholipase L1-like esterase